MRDIINKFLDSTFDKPLSTKTDFGSGKLLIYVMCNDTTIARGIINSTGTYTYTSWVVSYETEIKLLNYFDIESDEIYDIVIPWVRIRCKKDGVTFVGSTIYNMK